MTIAVMGAGAWGTALAVAWSGENSVRLYCRSRDQFDALSRARENARYLPGVAIPENVRLAASPEDALADATLAVLAVPVAGLRETLGLLGRRPAPIDIVWVCKGFEAGSGKLPHQMAAEELPAGWRYAALSGPSFADEVARGLPAAVTLASRDAAFAGEASRALHTGRLRVYSSEDLVGVEIGGAVKNVIAIAAGICDGLKLGNSARAALITRGLAEMSRLGLRLGGRLDTFMGLSGIGDLALTCTSDLSRNRRIGLALAAGRPLADALAGLGHVAEGVFTAREVLRLSDDLGVDMPIASAVCSVLDGQASAQDAVEALLQREPKPERLH
ncbi:MAG: NAD(P)H-dependent glycerol-3-phosphate dehydrogenase [Burkholderiales bacterium]